MAHTYSLKNARASSAANPVSFSVTVAAGDTVIVLLLKAAGAAVRSGGSPTYDGVAMSQASTQQIAAASPEASAEIWYVCNPEVGTATLSIPNSGTLTLYYTVAAGRAKAGGKSMLDSAIGANATGTNPSPGALTISETGGIAFAVVATGAQTWAPSAQVGTAIANTDDGSHGGGEQYILNSAIGSLTLSWTFGTSDDYGAVAVAFKEVPPKAINNYLRVRGDSGLTVGGIG